MLVYKLTCKASGKLYVGQTTRSLKKRFQAHCRPGRWPISLAIQKYGRDAFEIIELESCKSQAELNAAEKRWIEVLDSIVPKGYNVRQGGDATGSIPDFIRKKLLGQKRSSASRGRMCKPKTLEHREALSRGRWGREPTGMTEEKALEVFHLYIQRLTQADIARKLGVSKGLVKAILHRRTWKQVAPPLDFTGTSLLWGKTRSLEEVRVKIIDYYQKAGALPNLKSSKEWMRLNSWLRYHHGMTLADYRDFVLGSIGVTP